MRQTIETHESFEALSLGGRTGRLSVKPSDCLQNAVGRRWTYRDDVVIEHHESQSPVTFQWILIVVGCKCISSAICETGTRSLRYLRTASAFWAAVKERPFLVIRIFLAW